MSYVRSQAAKARWAKPGAREAQADRIREAAAQREVKTYPKGRMYGARRGVTLYLDESAFAAVERAARAQKQSFSEVVRTYVEWGLEAEEKARRAAR